jgi:glycolate oxidase iron-sulfur subunit
MHPNLSRSLEICRFLADLEWPRATRLRPLRSRVAVHQPCSHRNVLRDGDAAFALLRRIPQVELIALAGNAACCGAAGTYMLEYPMMSDILLHPKIDDVRQLRADFLVTTNTGCALHLAAGARAAGLDLEVLHPVELIERQLSS